jgi:prolyl 3-hydroxylase /prolyl 3,4-dihydroxylase
MPKQGRQDTSNNNDEKRAKLGEKPLGSPLDPKLFSPEKIAKLKEAYKVSWPYPHVHVDQLCLIDRAKDIQEEAKTCLKADFKETDIFKVYQTPDFANLVCSTKEEAEEGNEEEDDEEGLATTVAMSKKWHAPNLVALRDAIYSKEFREFVADMAGCEPLEGNPDLSCNVYASGGHLLCHDDVINTRRISFIIYLTDPEDEWTPEDGGALELYPISKEKGIGFPETTPVKNVLPMFNSMFFFTVTPGQSFHAVQEVFSTGKPRLSISGWYHGKEPPPGMEFATRAQLGANADATNALVSWRKFADEKPEAEEEEEEEEDDEELKPISLSKEDIAHLSKWINPQYLDLKVLSQLRDRFLDPENGSAVSVFMFFFSRVCVEF